MNYIYHYHAIRYDKLGATIHHDGVAACKRPVDTSDEFGKLKEQIAAEAGVTRCGITICSLSLLSHPGLTTEP